MISGPEPIVTGDAKSRSAAAQLRGTGGKTFAVDAVALRGLPTGPGCYLLRDVDGHVLYVGKAKNLRRRVASYFRSGGPGLQRLAVLVRSATSVEIHDTGSEVEALLLENRLIKDLQPPYNVRLKDGKEFPVLAITHEEFPRVFITRDHAITQAELIGPFTSSAELKRAYHFLMRAFQFRDCRLDIRSADPRRRHFHPCLNYHIKRCSAPCAARIDAAQYGSDIAALRSFLAGRGAAAMIADLDGRMRQAADGLCFEEAARHRDQIAALRSLAQRGNLRDHALLPAPVPDGERALRSLARALSLNGPPRLIEGFDIAHLMGSDVVAAMVSFVDGRSARDGYRHYRIRGGVEGARNDDLAAMREVVSRRYRRLCDEDQPRPDLIMIDGGLGQVRAAAQALAGLGLGQLALVGLAKEDEILVLPDGREIRLGRRHPGLRLLMYVRDEAHRFSRRYHHLLRAKGLIR